MDVILHTHILMGGRPCQLVKGGGTNEGRLVLMSANKARMEGAPTSEGVWHMLRGSDNADIHSRCHHTPTY